MKQMNISSKIRVVIICLLPWYAHGAEKDSAQEGISICNRSRHDIEINYSFPLPHEYATTSPGGSQLISKGKDGILPSEMDIFCIKVGALRTNHLLVEDKITPLVIMDSPQGHFLVYQETKRHLLSLQSSQQKNKGFCSLQ